MNQPTTTNPSKRPPLGQSPRYEAKRQWSQLTKQVKEFEKVMLRLLRHPEATQEQIMLAHGKYVELYKSMKETEKHYLEVIKPSNYEATPSVSLTN